MKSSVYVLGGSGFIGANLVARLRAQGHRVATGTRQQPGDTAFRLPEDFADIVATHDWVVHAASASTPSSSAGSPLLELDENLRTTLALATALQARPECRLLYLSSAGTLYADSLDGPSAESSPLEPRSYHGAGKVAAEFFLRALAAQYGCRVVAVRPSNVYGPGQQPRPGFGIIPTAFARCLDGRPLTVWGDGLNTRDYLYVDDLSELMLRIIQSDSPKRFHVMNAAFGTGHTLMQLLEAIELVTGQQVTRSFQPTRRTDARSIVPDPSAAEDSFGWRPRVALLDGLERTWTWFRSSGQ